jgi:peptidoglycan-N-acetylglucosamine deacetylase
MSKIRDINPFSVVGMVSMNNTFRRAALLTICCCSVFFESCSASAQESPLKSETAPLATPNTAYARPPYAPITPPQVTWNYGRKDLNYIALTFDDGPHPQNTPRLLDMLRARNVKATFFVTGRCVDLYPRVAKRIVDEGHEIANHTYTHGNLAKMSNAGVRSELDRGRDAIKRATGYLPRVMRPPYGALRTDQRKWIMDQYGYPTILWAVDPMDWKDRNANLVASRLINRTTPGAILLAHDLHKTSVDAMPRTLDSLLSKGFKFVTVSQMIQMTTGQL